MNTLPNALAMLAAYRQWLCYKIVPSKRRPGKMDKFPVSTTTAKIVDAHNPAHWVDAQTALNAAASWGSEYGVGFVFTENDPFFFLDIDDAFDGQQWSPLSKQLIDMFPGAAVEVSQSNTGLHIIGMYSGAAPDHGCRNDPLGLELYTAERFVALTGTNATGDVTTIHDANLNAMISGYFPYDENDGRLIDWTTEPAAGYRPVKDDDALIEKMLDSKSPMNRLGKASARDLWEANADALARTYPDDVRDYDASAADGALAQHLAFWTAGNCERIEYLMRQSALCRDKWDYHKKYMTLTIKGAVARCNKFYEKGSDVDIVEQPTDNKASDKLREGPQLMSTDQQIAYFTNCVYVCDVHRMFTPTGSILKAEQFNAMYGGYAFALDSDLDKTTKKAFEAFTESQCVSFPKADSSCFRPQLPSGSIINEEGFKLVNTYVPINIPTSTGDVTPFLTHLQKLLPDERDRTILLSYMAACVQFKGYKIQWAPLLQGVEGNGKTLFSRCVAYAIGERYTHMPRADEIGEKFNAWLFEKLFIGVEDIYVPDHKREVIEVLKPMITNKRLAKRAMATDQTMHDVCANFIFNSNYKDAVRKTQNDRRFCVFYSAQQEAAHITRDGMGGDYFPSLYAWLDNGGYAAVAGYLAEFAIPEEFNPTTQCQRAPATTSTEEAIAASAGGIEQEIMEAVEEGRTGFAGGWVSSFALDNLLKDLRKDNQIARNKRGMILKDLGYEPHPGLKNGRVNNPLPLDGGKPKLYIKVGHIHSNLTNGAEISRQYSAAQGDQLALLSVDGAVNSGIVTPLPTPPPPRAL